MRHRETGSGEIGRGEIERGESWADRRGRGRAEQVGGRRLSRGPRPVRPATVPVVARPGQPPRPVCRAVPVRPGPRLLVRRSAPVQAGGALWPVVRRVPAGVRARVSQVLVTIAVTLASAAAVVVLGMLADVAAQSRTGGAPAPAVSTGSLTPVFQVPGQVLRVPSR